METKSSILVIDDEPIVCESCQRILKTENYNVDTVTNPILGLQKAMTNNYDLILLDLSMDEMDGMQLLARMRENKNNVPVIIITGYPTKKSKNESAAMGILHYILKPFKPSEILDPVKSVISKTAGQSKKGITGTTPSLSAAEWKAAENYFRFHKDGWLQAGVENCVRTGGQFTSFIDEPLKSITLPGLNDDVYRGLPLAEVNFSNGSKLIIPAAISGKIIKTNTELSNNPSLFESETAAKSWIADIAPSNPDAEMPLNEVRKVVFLRKDENAGKEVMTRLTNLGYTANNASSAEEAIKIISKEAIKVVLLDANSLQGSGVEYAEKIKKEFPDIKIVVLNTSNSPDETLYHQKKVYYYAVHPVSVRELSSILYNTFCHTDDNESLENAQTTFLPPAINRVYITNKHSKKVALLAYNNLLQANKGIGYLLIKNLLDKSFPLEANHTRAITSPGATGSEQELSVEKAKNDRIILLYQDDIKKIPGNIIMTTELYENSNGADNRLIRIIVQRPEAGCDDALFVVNTVKGLASILEHEMTTK